MSILSWILLVVGGLIGGFVLAFMVFFMVTYFNDWRLKRKFNKVKKEDMLVSIKQDVERGDEQEDDNTKFAEFREFEKLRNLAKRDRGSKGRESTLSDEPRIAEREYISNEALNDIKPIDKPNSRNKTGIKFY